VSQRKIGRHLFYALALLGWLDVLVFAWTDCRIKLIRGILGVFFGECD